MVQRPNQAVRSNSAYLDEIAPHLNDLPTDRERLRKLRLGMNEPILFRPQPVNFQPSCFDSTVVSLLPDTYQWK